MCHLFTYKYIVYHVFPHKTVTTKYQAIEINSKSTFLPDIQMMEGFFKNHVGANYFLNNFFDYKPQSLSVWNNFCDKSNSCKYIQVSDYGKTHLMIKVATLTFVSWEDMLQVDKKGLKLINSDFHTRIYIYTV